ncbi:hypothetical protein M513_03876 [Trichuris suis]|uniref:Galactosylgalactosylxylosylprotein 3-beta-glucuronosyltransferase n=1 Tax=Trichuris suis TaxID=68888 RepID=A0A085MDD9_9BILA|nr:hypothetical protein M513_03876 [Trichuris suis]
MCPRERIPYPPRKSQREAKMQRWRSFRQYSSFNAIGLPRLPLGCARLNAMECSSGLPSLSLDDGEVGLRSCSCRTLMDEDEYGSGSWTPADSRLELPEEEVFKVELMYSSRTSQAFVCPCLANLYRYGRDDGDTNGSSDDWILFATGVPLLVVDSGAPSQSVAKLQIRLAELGTGFTLWRQPVSPFTRLKSQLTPSETPNSIFGNAKLALSSCKFFEDSTLRNNKLALSSCKFFEHSIFGNAEYAEWALSLCNFFEDSTFRYAELALPLCKFFEDSTLRNAKFKIRIEPSTNSFERFLRAQRRLFFFDENEMSPYFDISMRVIKLPIRVRLASYCAVDSGFHTMFTSTVGRCQTVGISFDHQLSAKKFYQQLRLLQSSLSKTESVGDRSATVPRLYLPCAQDTYMSVSNGVRRSTPTPSKSSISGPCCFRHITSLRPSDLLMSYETAMTSSAAAAAGSQGDRSGSSRRAFARGARSFTNLYDPKDSLLNDKKLKTTMQSPLAARSSPTPTSAQTTVVLPPYFFGGASGSRQIAQTRTPGRQVSLDKSLPSSPWAHSSPTLVSPKISRPIQRTPQVPRGPPVRSMLEGVSSGLHGLSPVRYDLTSRSLSKGGDLSLTNTMECTTNGGYSTTNGFPTASQLDPFYTQGEDLVPERDLDSACISPSSNWMHILYQSRMQANLALGKNGKIFAGRIKEVIKRFRLRSMKYQRAESSAPSVVGIVPDDFHSRSLSYNGFRSATPFELESLTSSASKYENDSKRSMRSMTAPMDFEEEEEDTSVRGIASKGANIPCSSLGRSMKLSANGQCNFKHFLWRRGMLRLYLSGLQCAEPQREYASDLRKVGSRLQSSHDSIPTIYVVTPTYKRYTQKADLTRLSYTLMHVPNILWIVVEDASATSTLVTNVLLRSGVEHVLLAAQTPKRYKLKNPMAVKNWIHPRGVAQRNAALTWLRSNLSPDTKGVLYFADDDNTYDLRIFEEDYQLLFSSVLYSHSQWSYYICQEPFSNYLFNGIISSFTCMQLTSWERKYQNRNGHFNELKKENDLNTIEVC